MIAPLKRHFLSFGGVFSSGNINRVNKGQAIVGTHVDIKTFGDW